MTVAVGKGDGSPTLPPTLKLRRMKKLRRLKTGVMNYELIKKYRAIACRRRGAGNRGKLKTLNRVGKSIKTFSALFEC